MFNTMPQNELPEPLPTISICGSYSGFDSFWDRLVYWSGELFAIFGQYEAETATSIETELLMRCSLSLIVATSEYDEDIASLLINGNIVKTALAISLWVNEEIKYNDLVEIVANIYLGREVEIKINRVDRWH